LGLVFIFFSLSGDYPASFCSERSRGSALQLEHDLPIMDEQLHQAMITLIYTII